MPALIKDVARAAKVSATVVSVVLNNRHKDLRISEATCRRVLRAAKKLHYSPNPNARSLRTKRSLTVGLVCNSPLGNWRMLTEAESLVNKKGFYLLVAISRWDRRREEDEMRRLLEQHVDGLILLSPAVEHGSRKLMVSLARAAFPLVGIGPTIVEGMDMVDWRRESVFRDLALHLLDEGCRRFALLACGGYTPGVRARIRGLRSALKTRRGTGLHVWQLKDGEEDEPADETTIAVQGFLNEQHPDAIVCVTDILALTAIRAAKGLGLRVPQDMAVTGSGNTRWGEMLEIPLTTVQWSEEELVRVAMDRLFERIEQTDGRRGQFTALVPAELVVRESSRLGKEADAGQKTQGTLSMVN